MSTVVLEANKRITIDTFNETIEIKKQDGQELEERRKQKGCSSLAEIWKRLGRQ